MYQWTCQFICLSLISFVVTYRVSSKSTCLWHNNTCVEFCPEWMIVNKGNCTQSYWEAQRTCDNPEPRLVGTVCGFSRCDCPEPTVLDTETGYCYDEDNCPTRHNLESI